MQRNAHPSRVSRGATARRDNVRIRIPTWCQDHVDPPAIIGKSAYRKRDTRLLWRVNQTAYWRRILGYVYAGDGFTRGPAIPVW